MGLVVLEVTPMLWQVNGELKNLLVAAMGEDLETRVHLLTEDKLQLARALLNSAQRLSTHQEQTEWLAGQCEVWRSKFLASRFVILLSCQHFAGCENSARSFHSNILHSTSFIFLISLKCQILTLRDLLD
jgi:hypothetical protein